MTPEGSRMDASTLQAALLKQPRHALFPSADQYSPGLGEAGWRAAVRAGNEQLIPRALTLGFQVGAQRLQSRDGNGNYLSMLLSALRLQAAQLAEDREVVAMVLQLGLAEVLPLQQIGHLLDAVPQHLRTAARPQIEVRLDAGSGVAPERLRDVGCTRFTLMDRAGEPGPARLADALRVGFTACCYQLSVPAADDADFLRRLQAVLTLRPERIALPAPETCPSRPCTASWLQAWTAVRHAGYVAIGADHYQRGDIAVTAGRGGDQRHCDLSGVPRRDRSDFIGIGLGACSQLGDVFLRLENDLPRWQERLRAGQIGVVAGLILSEQERLADEAAQSIACDHALDADAFHWRNGREVSECFEDVMPAIDLLVSAGVAWQDRRVLRLTEAGRLVWRTVAGCFRLPLLH